MTLQAATKDTYLGEAAPNTNFGGEANLWMSDIAAAVVRSIIEFDLSTMAGKTPITAIFSLNYYSAPAVDPVGKTIYVYKLTPTDWVELQATWNIYKTANNWTAAGGDYEAVDPAGVADVVPAGFGWMDWSILDILNDALDGGNDLELLLKFDNENSNSQLGWRSAEYGTAADRPKLVIEYIEPPTNVTASKGTLSDKVVINWTKSNGVTEYQVYRDDVGLGWLGDVDTFDDENADAPVITAGAATASKGKKYNSVVLNNSGESIADGTTHTYKVTCRSAGIESDDSNTDTGYRGAAPYTYQWQRSAADSDASYSDIEGATTKKFYDYNGPESPAGRYYRCKIEAYTSTTVYSTVARGYRRDPTLPEVPLAADIIIKDIDGNTLAYAKNAYGIGTDYRTNELAIMEFNLTADNPAREYLVYPNEAWLYVEGELVDIYKIIDTEDTR